MYGICIYVGVHACMHSFYGWRSGELRLGGRALDGDGVLDLLIPLNRHSDRPVLASQHIGKCISIKDFNRLVLQAMQYASD